MSEKKISVVAPIAIATITANEKNLGPRDTTMEYHGPSGFTMSLLVLLVKKQLHSYMSLCVCVRQYMSVHLLFSIPPGLYTHYRSLSPPPRNPVNAHCSPDTHRKRIEAGSLSHTNSSRDESRGQALGASKARWGDAYNHIQDIEPVCICVCV